MRVLLIGSLLVACSTPTAAADGPRSWRFATGATPTVEIQNISGKVKVTGAAGNEVAVEAVTRGGSEADRARWVVEAQVEGATVHVRARCGEDGRGCHSSATVDITVAAPSAARLTVRGVSSDLDVSGVTGALEAESTSGDVRVSGAGPVSLRTVSGDVRLEGAAGATIQSVSGDLTLRGIRGESRLHTVSGDVGWDGSCGAGCRLTAETVSGDLHLRLARASSFALEYHTRSGDLADGFGGIAASREGAQGRVGRGEGAISVHTVSGDLTLEPR